ncbi:MAG: radical SAM protein, partial [Candidatus Omnitrophota bacterium]
PHQNPVRKRSVDNIIRELEQIKIRLPFVEHIKFDDDAFFLYTEDELKEFSIKYKKNIDLPLGISGATPSSLTREKLSCLVDAGLEWIRMGIQTGSERTKNLYKRVHSNQQVIESVRIINEFKDKIKLPQYDIIIDNPWETEEDLIETLKLLAKLPTPYYLSLFSLIFYPGTELYEKAKRDGIVTDDRKEIYRKYFHGYKKTYLIRLFHLLDGYARRGSRIPPKIMPLLLSRILRQARLGYVLYFILRIFNKAQRLKSMLYESLKDMRRGLAKKAVHGK